MSDRGDIFKCDKCGMITEVLTGCDCDPCMMQCCGQGMKALSAKTADQGKEKHVPVFEKVEGGLKVKVGDVPHPMEEKHYIEWIEIMADGKVCRQYLKPGQAPEAVFCTKAENVSAREHCTIHGLWKA